MKFHSTLIIFLLLFLSTSTFAAEEYVCSNGDAKRVISVAYENDKARVPCEVQYDKGEGVQTLWSAQTDLSYCKTKASEFVEKQESWGWSCEKTNQEMYAEDLVSDLY